MPLGFWRFCRFTLALLQVADEIWICEKETVTKWEGDILEYKQHLKNKVMKELRKAEKAALQQQNGSKSSSNKGKW